MAMIYGVPSNDGVSSYLKCHIYQEIDGVPTMVVGYLTESCELALNSLWESPFNDDTLGNLNRLMRGANIGQSLSENTSRTLWNSQQVWNGTEPPEITMQIKLIAFDNAYEQVNKPILSLMQMASPNLLELLPIDLDVTNAIDLLDPSTFSADSISVDGKIGRIPSVAMFDIGRRIKLPMRISSVSFDANAPKTAQGYYAYNTVNIVAAPKQMFNRNELQKYFI